MLETLSRCCFTWRSKRAHTHTCVTTRANAYRGHRASRELKVVKARRVVCRGEGEGSENGLSGAETHLDCGSDSERAGFRPSTPLPGRPQFFDDKGAAASEHTTPEQPPRAVV